MKYQSAAAGAALASLASAALQHGHRHANLHERDLSTEIDWQYVTVTEYVTATAAPDPPKAPFVPESSTAEPSVLSSPTSIARHVTHSRVHKAPASSAVSSSAPASSAPVSSAPASYAPASSASSSSAPASSSGISKDNLTPNGKKAGLSGYPGIVQNANSAFSALAPYISWYSDYLPNTADAQGVMGIPMLWGADGSACSTVTPERLATFNSMVSDNDSPSIMFGFYEPDCTCTMSSDMSTSDGTTQWNALLAPLASKGTILGSPSMCKQKDEDWLQPFVAGGLDADWDVTALHINKPDFQGVVDDVEYYLSTYKKPLWIQEFACVDDVNGFVACTDQGQINQFISDAVKYFEANESVVAYGPSNGEGLGTVWPLTTADGELSASGQAYLDAIKSL